MATTARPSSTRNSTTGPTSLPRGPTARSAAANASPRVPASISSPLARRSSTRATPPPILEGTREALSASLKQETDQKELLLVQVQNKDLTISTLTTENDNLTSALNAAEVRLNELYSEQARSEVELAQRMDISEKLRGQVRELEKEKRDIQRRYNEQTTTFEAERQAFYDNEQHLKSRIQSLSQVRKRHEPTSTSQEPDSEAELDDVPEHHSILRPGSPKQDLNDPDTEPAEMTSLRLELSTLSTSYSSLQSTLVLLQTQLVDLKRVNHELQEENESYMILLRERTLNGQFDLLRQVGGGSSEDGGADDDHDDDDDDDDDYELPEDTTDHGSLRSNGRNTLDRVPEDPLEDTLEQQFERSLAGEDMETASQQNSRHPSRPARKRTISTSRGESLADLPITGPGLDLAAELGRAENKDILDGNVIEDRDRSMPTGKAKKAKRNPDGRKASISETTGIEPSPSTNDVDALRNEVKSLRDANKALSLYASKIIDRIIAQEGFEHVLAVDYDKQATTPAAHTPKTPTTFSPPSPPKPRPQSVLVGRSTSSPMPAVETHLASPPPTTSKAQRRSLSFDWKNFSIFAEKKPETNLRPLTLKPGATMTGARKLETHEDEEDRKERERLNATMKLMGIQPPAQSPPTPAVSPKPPSAAPSIVRRFSLFGSKSTPESETSSVHSNVSFEGSLKSGIGLGMSGGGLTQEALAHAEAENTIAALDAHERNLSAEIARGASSGFTEIAPRAAGRRSRRSAGGSGSGGTVWSAGMGEDGAE